MFNSKLLIRADASSQIGFGHVLRCLSLAQAWQDAGGEAIFVCADLPEMLEARLKAENCEVVRLPTRIGGPDDAVQTQSVALASGANWVVCDGYNFGSDFLRALKNAAFGLLMVDDFSSNDLSSADVIVNPNAGADENFYLRFVPPTRVFAGQRFALLRREFRLQNRAEKEISENVERVLIAMGAADTGNLAPRALDWLQNRNFRGEVVVLSGARESNFSSFDFDLKIVSARNEVPDWMHWCDVAIAAAGSTTWELASCGVPAILNVVAENQVALAHWCDENKLAFSLGEADKNWGIRLGKAWQTLQNPAMRREMSKRAQGAIDGQGAARVVQKLWPDALQLRLATMEDARVLWEWRNDVQTRAMSLQSDFVEWETHRVWLETHLKIQRCAIWVAEKNGSSVGSVRFTQAGDEAIISLVVAPQWRGQRMGKAIIQSACRAIFGIWNINAIRANIKSENIASRRAFENAGFSCDTVSPTSAMSHLTLFLERQS